MTGNGGRLGIVWNGELVGYLEDPDLETVDVARSYKTRGRWVPLELPATDEFLHLLKESLRLEVTVNDGVPGMEITFSMGLDGEAWLYAGDLIGWRRFLGPSET